MPTTLPGSYVQGIIITPRQAYVLEQAARLTELRSKIRGNDSELDQVLHDIRLMAMAWAASVNGRTTRKATEATVNWYSPAQVAAQTGVTEHAVRLAIREGRLSATKTEGRWQVTPADYAAYRATHRR